MARSGPAHREHHINLPGNSPSYQKDSTLLAGTEAGDLLISENHGSTWTQIQYPASQSPINAIVLSPEFPSSPEVMILTSDEILISDSLDQSWKRKNVGGDFSEGASCISTPLGLKDGSPLLVGLGDGTILRVA